MEVPPPNPPATLLDNNFGSPRFQLPDCAAALMATSRIQALERHSRCPGQLCNGSQLSMISYTCPANVHPNALWQLPGPYLHQLHKPLLVYTQKRSAPSRVPSPQS